MMQHHAAVVLVSGWILWVHFVGEHCVSTTEPCRLVTSKWERVEEHADRERCERLMAPILALWGRENARVTPLGKTRAFMRLFIREVRCLPEGEPPGQEKGK